MSKVVSGRVPEGLAAWCESYAVSRGVKRAVIVEAALEHFRGLCAGGVPDLPERGQEKATTATATSPESMRATHVSGSRRVDTVDQARQWALARQQKLNDAKGRSK